MSEKRYRKDITDTTICDEVCFVEDGGVAVNTSGENAPKSIDCCDIVSFTHTFSTVTLGDDIGVEGGEYIFGAYLKKGKAEISYSFNDYNARYFEKSAIADKSFFSDLFELVRKYDIPQYNGRYHRINGLPGGYGEKISILFADGQEISASDNQDTVMPPEAFLEIRKLFAAMVGADDKGEC